MSHAELMLIVRVELHSAITGEVSEIARMIIVNDSTGTHGRGNYWGLTAKGTVSGGEHMSPPAIMQSHRKMRRAEVKNYPRTTKHVWHLVARMLAAMKYK